MESKGKLFQRRPQGSKVKTKNKTAPSFVGDPFSTTHMEYLGKLHLPKTNMTMETQPFEDVSPIKKSWLSICHVSLRGN